MVEEYAPERYRRYLPSVHSRTLWTVCIVLAGAGNAAYLMWMNDRIWFVGMLAVTPLVILISVWIEDRREQTGIGPQNYGGTDGGGPMGPPMA